MSKSNSATSVSTSTHHATLTRVSVSSVFQPLALRSMLWRPMYLEQSAWLEHIPFAFWLVEAHRPQVLVELGAHYGVSYFAFCQAVDRLGLDTRCFAVDTWKGDEHAGLYDERVFEQVRGHNEAQYSGFSRLVRSTFDEALKHFDDGSIDLLHIDGLHTFEAVRHDFETWLPKLSRRAIVVLHDTNVRERNFGVFKLLDGLKQRYPHFEFVHGHGLGVLGVGAEQDEIIQRLFQAYATDQTRQAVHEAFARLGRACADALAATTQQERARALAGEVEKQKKQLDELKQALDKTKADLNSRTKELVETKARLQTQVEQHAVERGHLAERVSLLQELRTELKDEVGRLQGRIESTSAELSDKSLHLAALTEKLNSTQAEAHTLSHDLAQLKEKNSLLASELAQRDQVLANARVAAEAAQREQLRERDAELETLKAVLAANTDEVERLTSLLSEQTAELRKAQAEADAAAEQIAQLTREIAVRDESLAAARASVDEAQQKYEALHQQSLVRESELAVLKRTQDERVARTAHLEQTLNEQAERLDAALAEVQGRDTDLVELKQQLATQTDEREQALSQIKQLETARQELEQQNRALLNDKQVQAKTIADRFRELATLTKLLDERDRQLVAKEKQIEGQKKRVMQLKETVSWKATAPLRTLVRPFNKSRKESRAIKAKIALIEQSGLFDRLWYLSQYPDVAKSGADPIEHYLRYGAAEGKNPGPEFDTQWYLATYTDVAEARANPLVHYIKHGKKEGRFPKKYAIAPPPATPAPQALSTKTSVEPTAIIKPVILVSGEGTDRPGYIYRIERYADAFRKTGETAIIVPRPELSKHYNAIETAKLLYIWRANWRNDVAQAVCIAKEHGVPVVFDTDDLMIRPELATADYIDAIRFDKKEPSEIQRHYNDMCLTMLASDLATASTHELAWHMRLTPRRRPTFVLPNGYCRDTYTKSRVNARAKSKQKDGLIRVGYASGSRTHQADFRLCAAAVAEVLRQYDNCRLVLFRRNKLVTLDLSEYPEFAGLEDKIEWRAFVPHRNLPIEIARFDINLAPLEHGNPFCESKSELKFFEAALADVPTIASPTGPFRRAIVHNETGYLAASSEEWFAVLRQLIEDANLRRRIGREAHRRAMWPWGPTRRAEIARSFLNQVAAGRIASRAAHYEAIESSRPIPPVPLVDRCIVSEYDKGRPSQATVIISLFNYESYIEEALESVRAQTMAELDLVIVDDCSTDDSFVKARIWLDRHHDRFNRAVLAQHATNQGLGASRNTAFDIADTLYVMALDADNRLLPRCCAQCFVTIEREGAAFAYPLIQQFGDEKGVMGRMPFLPANLIPGNYIDAMAMISKEAWAAVGGYGTTRMGWQDYDLWCRFVTRGLHGVQVQEILAEYRVHNGSMLRTSTDKAKNKLALSDKMEVDHPWLSLIAERVSHSVSHSANWGRTTFPIQPPGCPQQHQSGVRP